MRGIFIPADLSEPIAEVNVDSGWKGIGTAIAKGTDEEYVYIERTPTNAVKSLLVSQSRYPSVDLWVDEEGLLKGLPFNTRAMMLYGEGLAGNALLLGEDMVWNAEDEINEPDAADLPPEVTVERVTALLEQALNITFL